MRNTYEDSTKRKIEEFEQERASFANSLYNGIYNALDQECNGKAIFGNTTMEISDTRGIVLHTMIDIIGKPQPMDLYMDEWVKEPTNEHMTMLARWMDLITEYIEKQ